MSYIQLDFKSQSLNRNVNLNIFLPDGEGLPAPEKPYKTLYFLPGFSASGRELATFLRFRTQCLVHGIAVVIPDGDNSWYLDKPERLAFYSQYIGQELLDYTRSILPLSDKREDTYIGGISMGGYGAMVHGFRYADKFSKIVAMSPAMDIFSVIGENPLYGEIFSATFGSQDDYYQSTNHPLTGLDQLLEKEGEVPELFITCGRQDELVIGSVKAFLKDAKEREVPVEYVEDDGVHDIFFWDKYLQSAFEFLKK